MADRSKELYRRGYNFVVELEKKRIPFQKVSGLSAEGNFEALREGGRNTVVYSLSNQTLRNGRLHWREDFSRMRRSSRSMSRDTGFAEK